MPSRTTAGSSRALSRRLRSALPHAVIDAPADARPRRDRSVDAAMYVVAAAIATATLVDTWEEHPPWLRPVAIVVGIAAIASLHWRRARPGAVGIGVGVVSLGILTVSGANVVALFNAAIRARGRDLAVTTGLGGAWAFVNPLLYPPDSSYGFDVGASLLLVAVALGWGLFVRARRELVRSLRDQAARAGEEARAAERRRIAREMHDVLAHRLSLLSVHAGALEFRRDASAAEVAAAAGVIGASARAALDELSSVIGVLREHGSETLTEPPQPTIADVEALVEESRAAGMRIASHIDLAGAEPTAAAGRTAYRIVQEGLTNARKHAPGAAVTLTVRATAGELHVEIRSLAAVAAGVGAAPLPGAGTGLIGLAERVALAGGELESGVDPAGAFVLRARLPR